MLHAFGTIVLLWVSILLTAAAGALARHSWQYKQYDTFAMFIAEVPLCLGLSVMLLSSLF